MSTTITTINPATGEAIDTYDAWGQADVERAVTAGAAAAEAWGLRSLEDRVATVRRLSEQLRAGKDTYASLITQEMGKPIGESCSR